MNSKIKEIQNMIDYLSKYKYPHLYINKISNFEYQTSVFDTRNIDIINFENNTVTYDNGYVIGGNKILESYAYIEEVFKSRVKKEILKQEEARLERKVNCLSERIKNQ